MKIMKTAEQYLNKEISGDWNFDGWASSDQSELYVPELMIRFAQAHVKKALKEASLKAQIKDDPDSYCGNTGSEYPPDVIVDRDSILKSYPLTNIK